MSRSGDGNTLLMTSSDGFCSCLTFQPGELGTVYHPLPQHKHTPVPIATEKANASATSTPQPTPTGPTSIALSRERSQSNNLNPSPSPYSSAIRPASPARSMSASSIATQSSFAQVPDQNAVPNMNNPTPSMSSVPSIAAANSGTGMMGGMPLFTPPQTPGHNGHSYGTPSVVGVPTVPVGTKREAEPGEEVKDKRRRIAPTLVSEGESAGPPSGSAPEGL